MTDNEFIEKLYEVVEKCPDYNSFADIIQATHMTNEVHRNKGLHEKVYSYICIDKSGLYTETESWDGIDLNEARTMVPKFGYLVDKAELESIIAKLQSIVPHLD